MNDREIPATYDAMESFIVANADRLGTWPRLAWADVFGVEWQRSATDLGRYFAKQFCCMLATQRLPIPEDLITFLDGSPRCPSVAFMIYRNWRAVDAHRVLRRDGINEGITTFVGLLPTQAYQRDGRFSGVDYGYHIGYLWFLANWTEGSDRTSWWEHPVIDLPQINGNLRSRVAWRFTGMRQRWERLHDHGSEGVDE